MGLVADSVSSNGIGALIGYAKLLCLLLGSMLLFAFVINPIIVYAKIHRNPYPLVWKCVKTSGVTAFFTRSSAANIPVNLSLAKELGVNPDTYTVTIPLGATINMSGAAITISIMTLAAVHTLGISVDFPTALLLSVLSAIGACGASGVAGGSLLLIPMACSLFGISNDVSRTRPKRPSTRRQTSSSRQLPTLLSAAIRNTWVAATKSAIKGRNAPWAFRRPQFAVRGPRVGRHGL